MLQSISEAISRCIVIVYSIAIQEKSSRLDDITVSIIR